MTGRMVAIIGCGYVGSALGAALVKRGCEVVGTTTTSARADELSGLGIKPVVVKLAEVDRIRSVLADRAVVFLTVAPGGRQRDYREVYLDGVRNLLRAVERTAVRQIVYTSSTSVYGQDDGSWVDEDSPTQPTHEKGRILLAAERVLLDGAERLGITATVLRLSGIIGPGRDGLQRATRSAGQERDDGDVQVNLIHRDDIVSACVGLLDKPYHGALNLSSDEPILRWDYYDRLVAQANLPPIRWVSRGPAGPRGKRVGNGRIKTVLRLQLRHPSPAQE